MKNKKANQKTSKLKVLKIIHGYPPFYLAGSEVYSYDLCNSLSKHTEVTVFTRIEDEFRNPYEIERKIENNVQIIRVNKLGRDYTFRSKYIDTKIAEIFESYLIEISPDIVHIGHLSHLSVQIIDIVKEYNIPIVFTLHDFWMMCIRGQLIREDLSLCSGPNIEKCARCNEKYFLSISQAKKSVKECLKLLHNVNKKVDLFIAPSNFLRDLYIRYGIPEEKIIYMDYGFDKDLFKKVKRTPSEIIRFGFLGRIIPVKGIKILIEAFNKLNSPKSELNIYGELPASFQYLKNYCRNSAINFHGSFNHEDVGKIFSNIDVLIVPSIWYENSPLVIHEGFLAHVPVITSNLGGMAELVKDGVNGLLFQLGNSDDLMEKMKKFIDNPSLIENLSQSNTKVRSIQEDVEELLIIYNNLIEGK